MSHHVFVQKRPTKHHVGFGVLVALFLLAVVAGWTFTSGRALLARLDEARDDLGVALQTAKSVRDQVVPAPEPVPEPEPAPTAAPKPDFDPVIEQMKQKLEADQAKTN